MTVSQMTAPTLDDVWRLFQETDQKFQETDQKFQETDRILKERSLETDRKFQETDRKFQETDRKFQETDRLLKERSLETDRKFQETDRKIQAVTQSLGKLGNRLGDFVEELVKPGLVRVFQGRGLKVHRTMQNLVCRDDNGQYLAQVDLIAVDTDTVIAVECKSQLSAEDVTEHLERLTLFKSCWPEYRTYTVLGAVAAMVLPEDVGRFANRRGLYVLAQSGETLEIRNDGSFVAKVW
jgi:hypothetical protein